MKIYHFSLLFVMLFVTVMIVLDTKMSWSERFALDSIVIDGYLDEAVNAAAWELRAAGTELNKETVDRCVDSFYGSLFASFGIMDDPDAKSTLLQYIPRILINGKEYDALNMDYMPENGDVSFAAYMEKYPLYSGNYYGYSISATAVKERKPENE